MDGCTDGRTDREDGWIDRYSGLMIDVMDGWMDMMNDTDDGWMDG